MYDCFSKRLELFFNDYYNTLFCSSCIHIENLDQCLDYHTDLELLDNIFEKLLNLLCEMFSKEGEFSSVFNLKTHNLKSSEFKKVLMVKIHIISKCICVYMKVKFENFKQNFIISHDNLIKDNFRANLNQLNLLEIYENILLNLLKTEIKSRIESLEFAYDKMILEEIAKYS